MLRNLINDKKSDIPPITAEYISNLISAYHAHKSSQHFFHLKMFSSPMIRLLEQFYNNQLKDRSGKLTAAEVFEFCKILYSHNHRNGTTTKAAIHTTQLSFFDERVDAALANAVVKVGKIDALKDHFDIICKNPSMASAISDSVLLLDHIINHPIIAKAHKPLNLFSKQIYDAMKTEPQHGIDVLKIHELICENPNEEVIKSSMRDYNTINSLLAGDALLFISLKLYKADQFDMQIFQQLHECTHEKLIELATQVDKASNPLERVQKCQFTRVEGPLNYCKDVYREEKAEVFSFKKEEHLPKLKM